MKIFSLKYILLNFTLTLCATSLNISYSQDLVEDISSPIELNENREMFTETIRIIGRSRRVFIITNTNQMLFKGDFITLVLGERDAVARAVVAKNHNELVGIKVLRIYSLKNWKKIRKNLDVNILKGDDSWLFKKVEKKEKASNPEDEVKINSEEDLYNEDVDIDQDLDSFGKDNRLIKPDNIVSASWARYSIENPFTDSGETETQNFNEFQGAWAYQFSDNLWVEGLLGQATLDNVPQNSFQTVVTNLTARVKYTFQAPLYSYFQPYIGFQIRSVSSPNAGKDTNDQALATQELAFIDDLKKSQIVFGVTILRRLVPGWFAKVDLGNDTINLGVGIEF